LKDNRNLDKCLKEKIKVFDDIDKMYYNGDRKSCKTNNFNKVELNPRIIINNIQIKDNNNSININNLNINSQSLDIANSKFQKNSNDLNTKITNLDTIKHIIKSNSINVPKENNSSKNLTSKSSLDENYIQYLSKISDSRKNLLPVSKSKSLNVNRGFKETGKIEEKIRKNTTETGASINSMSFSISKSPSFTTLKISDSRNTLFSKSLSSKFFSEINLNLTGPLNSINVVEKNDYSKRFQPVLNKNSLKIAEKLGSSFERLTSLKKSSKSLKNDSLSNCSFISNYSKLSKSSFDHKTLGHSLYERALSLQQKKKDKIIEKERLSEVSHQKFSYSPDLSITMSKSKPRVKSEENKRDNISIYERHIMWEKQKETKLNKIKKSLTEKENQELTLRPQFVSVKMKDDNEFINKNVNQIFTYVERLNKSNLKKQEYKNVINRVFNNGKKFTGKKTIVQEFHLSSSNYKGNNPVHIDQLKNKFNINELKRLREKFKTNEFFDNKISNTDRLDKGLGFYN